LSSEGNLARPLRILMTVDPEIPVPPIYYGGIERIVHMLVDGLVKRGHQVHLFAHPQSQVPAILVPYPGQRSGSRMDTLMNARRIYTYARHVRIDVIHSFARLAYLLGVMPSSTPKIQSYQRHISPRSIRVGRALGGRSLHFAACSRACAASARAKVAWTIIPNGVPLEKYRFNPIASEDAPLVFLGRVERIKGAHTAIQVARETQRKLIIAGNHAERGPERDYFVNAILPYCDGSLIRYIGPVNDAQKNELLGQAAALLFPIEWEEPFGIVMVEALACGTPVIAFKRGAVPEVVEHGTTGYVCDTEDDMVNAVQHVREIERAACRRDAEARFSEQAIVQRYEAVYRTLAMAA